MSRLSTILALACVALGIATIVAAAYAFAALMLTTLRVIGGLT